jgi:hypothetical protein
MVWRGEEAAKAEEAEATHASAWGAKGAERRRHFSVPSKMSCKYFPTRDTASPPHPWSGLHVYNSAPFDRTADLAFRWDLA